ncbi:hypothetical protein [uncultured Fibrella sp.]|uniref:hypothetical protein n=1 Tax=uncultured Fibrella sp. TaxID=1284596 RepID=UPI0035CB9B6A
MHKLLLTALTLGTLLTSFTPVADPATDILGPWKVAADGLPNAKKQLIERLKGTNPEIVEQLEANPGMAEQLIESFIYDYKADGTLNITTAQGPQTNKWRFSDDKCVIIRTRSNSTEVQDSVISISPKQLVLATLPLRLPVTYERAN